MNEPRRLKDDPSFHALSNGALNDEPLAVGPFDLEGLRAKVVSGGVAPPTAPRWPTLVGVSGLTAALVTIALWALLPVGPGLPPVRPTPAPPVLQVGDTLQVERVVVQDADENGPLAVVNERAPTDGVAAIEAVVPEAVVHEAVVHEDAASVPTADAALTIGAVDEQEEPSLLPLVESPASAPSIDPSPAPRGEAPAQRSGLQAELDDYNRALDAAESGLWPEARERYAAYLQAWPSGRLRTEATLGLLGALVRSERPTEAEALAARLLTDATYRQRSSDIRLLRAEALVELHRCDEALASLEGLRRTSRTQAVRSACRQQRR